jgi:hypothetical protein
MYLLFIKRLVLKEKLFVLLDRLVDLRNFVLNRRIIGQTLLIVVLFNQLLDALRRSAGLQQPFEVCQLLVLLESQLLLV